MNGKMFLERVKDRIVFLQRFLRYDAINDIDISGLGLNRIPISFNVANGFFDCSRNRLKDLKGAPIIIRENLLCFGNELEDFTGFPEEIGGDIDCSINKIKSLVGCPKFYGDMDCSLNLLNDFLGCPEVIMGNFNCSFNPFKSIKGCPKKVKGDFYSVGNIFTEEEIRKNCRVEGKVITTI